MAWYQTKKATKLSSMDKSKILVFDTETTGVFQHRDEIIQLSILDGFGSVLYSSYIKPKRRKSWKRAERVNHISYEMVKDYPSFDEEKDKIQEIFNNAKLIVGYNVNFDINLIEIAGIIVLGETFDVMTEFAHFMSDTERQRYHNYKLIECARYFNYSFTPHDAEEDAQATLYCFNQLINNQIFTTYNAKKKKEYKRQAQELKTSEQTSSRGGAKIGFSFQVKTPRRKPILIKGLILLIIGEILYYLNSHSWFKNLKTFFPEIINSLHYKPVNYLEVLSLILIGTGTVITFIAIVRILINLPKWIIVLVKRLWNRLK